MKITIDPFNSKSISSALKTLKQYEKDFKAKESEFVRRLKELGVSVASAGFALADYDGINDVRVTETQNGNRALVVAYGETVGFIEFGTGIKFPEYNSTGLMYTPPPHGSYGQGKGARPKGWWFNQGSGSRHTYGNPPVEAMLAARDAMIEQVAQIARDVWK